jgi:DNA-binding response OmpR family regulator
MEKKHILIVEDEWIIYDELASFLTARGYSVAPYTKSYKDAIGRIKTKYPDLVLLDINLQGDNDGIDLAQKSLKQQNIAFIYLSAFTDELTIKRAYHTNPETFLIKTKPHIDKEQLAVSIRMAINKNKPAEAIDRNGILLLADYKGGLKDEEMGKIQKNLVRFEDIQWIETDEKKKNYLVFHSANGHGYHKNSLTKIKPLLPFYFVRINAFQIVNLRQMEGKINHSWFNIGSEVFKIGKAFSDEVHRVLHSLYVE